MFPSVITAPAPNAGPLLEKDPSAGPAIRAAFVRRAFALAHARGYETLLLGARGCGAFRNDPAMVADVFGELLESEFADVFCRVVFGVWEPKPAWGNKDAFASRLG